MGLGYKLLPQRKVRLASGSVISCFETILFKLRGVRWAVVDYFLLPFGLILIILLHARTFLGTAEDTLHQDKRKRTCRTFFSQIGYFFGMRLDNHVFQNIRVLLVVGQSVLMKLAISILGDLNFLAQKFLIIGVFETCFGVK